MTEQERLAALQILEREVGVLMRRTRRMVGERAVMVHPQLGPLSYLMLAHLVRQGPCRAAELSDVFCIDKGAVSRSISSMVEIGLVERHADPEDGRAQLVSATAEAAEKIDRVAELRLRRLDATLHTWDGQEITEFVSAFQRYNEILEQTLQGEPTD